MQVSFYIIIISDGGEGGGQFASLFSFVKTIENVIRLYTDLKFFLSSSFKGMGIFSDFHLVLILIKILKANCIIGAQQFPKGFDSKIILIFYNFE